MARFKPRLGFSEDEVQVLDLLWRMMKRSGYSVEFESFDAFLRYAKDKFDYGLTMVRIDRHRGWSPENIQWCNAKQPLRKKYAKELAQIESNKRQFFRYEHPDLVREGIVFEASR